MRFRADGVEYSFDHDFCSLRFDVYRHGDDIRLILNEATGPLEFCEDYEGTPRGVFSWEWFEIALEGSALDAGQDVPDQNSREFVRLADFLSMVFADEEYAKMKPRTPMKRIPNAHRASPPMRSENPDLGIPATRH